MSFATGFLEGLRLKELKSQQALAERHTQAEETYRQSELDFRKTMWSDQQRAEHAKKLEDFYGAYQALQSSFLPKIV